MSALWGRAEDKKTFRAKCVECDWEESAGELVGADGVMVAASLARQHNAEIHDWDRLQTPPVAS